VFTLAQLTELGLSPRAVQRRAACGRLHRVHHAVYSLAPPELLTRRGWYMAAVLACGPGAVFSHRSAADLHELRGTDRAGIEVTVPHRTRRLHGRVEVHRSLTLDPAHDVTIVDGIPCTTIPRTLLDLGAVLPRRAVERAIDQADANGVLDLGALQAQLDRHPRAPGAGVLRTVLVEHNAGATLTWSELEESFLAVCRAASVPEPEVNAWIVPDEGEPAIRADFVWREQRLIIETDGWGSHRTRRAFETDRRRDQRLTLAGWRVIRITWRQLTEDPAAVARLIGGLFRRL
jgi:hypothetical protein